MSIDIRNGIPVSTAHPANRPLAWLLPPLAALLVALLLVFFVWFDTFAVEGTSMLPTFNPEDRLLVTRSYDEPNRGDVVVLEITSRGVREEALKRVVALAGDTVVVDGDRVTVNGEQALPPEAIVTDLDNLTDEIIVPERSVFVLGDNRPVSLDSRFLGPVPLSDVRGRVVAIYTPITRIRLVDGASHPD